jgi:hypothetical protein
MYPPIVAESDVVRKIGPMDSTAVVVDELGVDGLDFDLPSRNKSRKVGVPAREDSFDAFNDDVKSDEEGFE